MQPKTLSSAFDRGTKIPDVSTERWRKRAREVPEPPAKAGEASVLQPIMQHCFLRNRTP